VYGLFDDTSIWMVVDRAVLEKSNIDKFACKRNQII